MTYGFSTDYQIKKAIEAAEAKEKNADVSAATDNNNSVFIDDTTKSDTISDKTSEKKENELIASTTTNPINNSRADNASVFSDDTKTSSANTVDSYQSKRSDKTSDAKYREIVRNSRRLRNFFKEHMAEATSIEEKKRIAAEFYKATGVSVDLPKMRALIVEYVAKHPNLDEKVLKKLCEQYEELRQIKYECMMGVAETNEDKEAATLAYEQDKLGSIEELQKLVAEYMPEDITPEEAEKKFRFVASHFAKLRDGSIGIAMDKYKMSAAFKAKMQKLAETTWDKIKESTNKFIKNFFETPKGKAIQAYAKRIFEGVKEKKEECKEYFKEAKIKTKEAKIAEKQSEAAEAEAKKAEKKAAQIVANLGFKNLTSENMAKVLKHESPKSFMEYQDAQAQKKKAYWIAYDAQSAKRLADAFLKIAIQSYNFAKNSAMMRITAAMNMLRG